MVVFKFIVFRTYKLFEDTEMLESSTINLLYPVDYRLQLILILKYNY